MKTEFQNALDQLSSSELSNLAKKLDTSTDYLTGHLYYARRTPRPELMNKLITALGLDHQQAFDHFYNKERTQAA